MPSSVKRIGVDFDNTIVCYDRVFSELAWERKLSPKPSMTKGEIRDHLRKIDRENDWTELQGVAYGPEILRAQAFPGAMDFFKHCRELGLETAVISHKTRHPFIGEKHDLHAAALRWLEANGFFDPKKAGLTRDRVFLELTKEDKLKRIGAWGSTHFIDDLPEFLGETAFPKDVERVLFDPAGAHKAEGPWRRADSWKQIDEWILAQAPSR